ncbi:MAG: DegT/DnrJ/EryC1/StrS aminotransferase [Chloroflexi bacterium HGW-Chloroflexi-10]|nr:MAG: DegT/DnrJ/EryC1/StrS aminotransferase [Chloroflexi bacterium HGW-Chloroflexi-10]
MEWSVPLADLDYGEAEEAAVLGVLRSKWLTMGAVTQEFEKAFAALCGAAYAISVSNATEALHLACLALGIGPGDEVIVPSLSFVATANAVLYTGADVVFADIHSEEDLTISVADIERKITPRTKAMIVMHYAGYACQMPELLALAKEHGLAVIEDVAHAPGAFLEGRALGTWGDVGCFSFFSNKNLATGEGGMLVTQREDLAQKFLYYRSHGMTTLTYDRHKGHAYSYDVVALGYNYRIDEIRAALGLAQLAKLAGNNQRRALLTVQYHQALKGLVELPFARHAGEAAYHILPVLLPQGVERKAFQDHLRDCKIQTSMHYPPIHRFSYYQKRYGINSSLPLTEAVAAREVTLPLYPGMTGEQLASVVGAIREFIHS